MKRNRFVQLTGATKSVNRDLEAKDRALAGLKGYITNLQAPTAEYVMGAYHQLMADREQLPHVQVESARAADLPPKRDSIEAHLTIVFAALAALAVTRWLERRTDWSIRKLITSLRRYHTLEIQAGDQIVTAADSLPNDIRATLQRLHGSE